MVSSSVHTQYMQYAAPLDHPRASLLHLPNHHGCGLAPGVGPRLALGPRVDPLVVLLGVGEGQGDGQGVVRVVGAAPQHEGAQEGGAVLGLAGSHPGRKLVEQGHELVGRHLKGRVNTRGEIS